MLLLGQLHGLPHVRNGLLDVAGATEAVAKVGVQLRPMRRMLSRERHNHADGSTVDARTPALFGSRLMASRYCSMASSKRTSRVRTPAYVPRARTLSGASSTAFSHQLREPTPWRVTALRSSPVTRQATYAESWSISSCAWDSCWLCSRSAEICTQAARSTPTASASPPPIRHPPSACLAEVLAALGVVRHGGRRDRHRWSP